MALTARTNLLTPNNSPQTFQGNYRSVYDFTNQYLPDYMPKLVNIYNPQSITGFLDTMGYEEGLGSDLAIWGEYGRRHKVETSVTRAGNVFTSNGHSVRLNDKIEVSTPSAAGIQHGLVTAVTANTFTAYYTGGAAWSIGTSGLEVRVYGDEHTKGSNGKQGALTRDFSRYSVRPMHSKEQFSVDGSEIPNISWLEDPEGNPYWYLEDEQESFSRLLDKIEYTYMVDENQDSGADSAISAYAGTQGLFSSITERGNTFGGQVNTLDELDSIVERLDQVNGELVYKFCGSTSQNLTLDKMLADELGFDAGTANYGIYGNENLKNRVLDLGFKGFRRGTYEFHYSGWNFLKDITARNPNRFNAADQVHAMLLPMGLSNGLIKGDTDRMIPEKIQYLTQMYKEKPGYSRKLVTYYDGAALNPAGGTTADRYEIHWLTERALRAVGMTKWFLVSGS